MTCAILAQLFRIGYLWPCVVSHSCLLSKSLPTNRQAVLNQCCHHWCAGVLPASGS
uniref:Uncharacterized protein n=1 Tax=Siphoviridae sp. ctL0q1 TaxID=2825449 RepID=A0A8S5PLA5_9CAUD|nr:MAG TPA: hypothetical protein [Siphoviridae sp. ctL0q1]